MKLEMTVTIQIVRDASLTVVDHFQDLLAQAETLLRWTLAQQLVEME
jgi:hypothetical protein